MPYAPEYPTYGGGRRGGGGTIADILRDQGRVQAEGAQRQGDIFSSLFSNVGQQLGGAIMQAGEEKKAKAATEELKAQDKAFVARLNSGEPMGPKDFVSIYGPDKGMKMAGAYGQLHQEKPDVRLVAAGFDAQSDPMKAMSYPDVRARLTGAHPELADVMPPQFDPEWWGKMKPQILGDKGGEGVTLSPGQVRFDASGKQIAAVPAEVKPPSYQHIETADGIRTFDPTTGKAGDVIARGKPAADPNAADMSNVKDVVAGMKEGTLPPQLPGRASREYSAVMAEAHRQGYDLAGAATDWTATQKHIATLNGSQQTRMAQGIDNASHSLDVIDDLASKWKGGGFPLLNKAQLMAAKSGAMGPKAQSIATQLEAQIADVTAELGNVYMGGNSPTDHALGLASKNLQADWSESTLRDMTKLARTNLQIRANSMRSVGVMGASENNPYAPPAPRAAAPAAPGGGGGIPTISSPEEARRLPRGSTFRTPDGRVKTVP